MTFGPCAGIYHRIAIPVFSSYLGEFSARMDRNVLGFLLALERVCYPPVAALNGILPVFTIQKKKVSANSGKISSLILSPNLC